MDLGLSNNVAMISGASRGIGRAIALGLAAEGCRLSLCARGQERLEETAQEARAAGVEVLATALDVTRETEARRWVEATQQQFGGIDILINNVGGSRPGGNLNASRQDWQAGFALNFFSALDLCQLVVPVMEERQAGCVINIASIYGREWGGPMTYNAAKAAMISLSKRNGPHACAQGDSGQQRCAGGRFSSLEDRGNSDKRKTPKALPLLSKPSCRPGVSGSRKKWRMWWSFWLRSVRSGCPGRVLLLTAASLAR